MTFKELALHETLLEAISYMNFETATPIQEAAIPKILEGKDLLACAQTGTGKTAAFILPVLHQLIENKVKGTSTLVLVPTRELAIQIDQQIQGLAYFTNSTSHPVYGGGDGISWEQERTALSKGSDIIVATPGRLLSHLNNNYVKFDKVEHFILDEADRMLDIGFYDDILKIASYLPKNRQTLLFSATMPQKIRRLAKQLLKQPDEINFSVSKPAEGVNQSAYLVFDENKNQLINHILSKREEYQSIIIFCSTKKNVYKLYQTLKRKNYNIEAVSSELVQEEREQALLKFKARQTRIIVATDVLSRGIDIKDINMVINFDVPNDAEDYVHRVGRTARAATTGEAITLVNKADMFKFQKIEELIEREVPKLELPESIGKGPEWDPKGKPKRKKFRPKNSRNKPKGQKVQNKKPRN